MFLQPLDLRALVVAEGAVTVAENKKALVAIDVDVVDPLLKPRCENEQRFDAFPLRGIGLPSRFFD